MCYSLLAVACAVAASAEPATIPLKEIWALDMPGTRNIRELDPPRDRDPQSVEEFIRTSVVETTVRALNASNWPKEGESAGRGFVVTGSGLDALREAQAILSKKKDRPDFVSAGRNLSLVFYSYSCARYVHLHSVERQKQTITVKYHFVPHRTLDMSSHFALIPLGELPEGKMRVRFVQVPITRPADNVPPMDRGDVRRIVCDSFSFGVAKMKE